MYEIIMVNNNSTDSTHDIAQQLLAQRGDVDFSYHVEYNQGLSYARNRGITESKYEIVVFLDDDAFARDTYVAELDAFYRAHPNVHGTGGKILPQYESGTEPDWMSKHLYSLVSAMDKGVWEKPFKKGEFPIGANMSIRKDVFEKIGTFNTDLGRTGSNLMGGEEKDMFLRMHDIGMSIWYVPQAEVKHMIPEKRTTHEFIKKLGNGIGISELLRCKNISITAYAVALLKELAIKWPGTWALATYHTLLFQPAKALMLLRFRWWVSSGLLGLTK